MHSLNPLKNNRCFGINMNGLLTSAGTANWQRAASTRANWTKGNDKCRLSCTFTGGDSLLGPEEGGLMKLMQFKVDFFFVHNSGYTDRLPWRAVLWSKTPFCQGGLNGMSKLSSLSFNLVLFTFRAWTVPKMAPALQKDTSPIWHTLEHEFKGLNIAQLRFLTVKNHLLDLVVSYLVRYHVQWTQTQEFPCITI